MAESTIAVQVVYADAVRQEVRSLRLPTGSTVIDAVTASGFADELPAGTVDAARLGVFSRRVSPCDVLREGDRVEIYRPLVLNPMEARRRRARKD